MGTGRLAGNVPLTRNLTGNENTARRGTTPPYGTSENGLSARKTALP